MNNNETERRKKEFKALSFDGIAAIATEKSKLEELNSLVQDDENTKVLGEIWGILDSAEKSLMTGAQLFSEAMDRKAIINKNIKQAEITNKTEMLSQAPQSEKTTESEESKETVSNEAKVETDIMVKNQNSEEQTNSQTITEPINLENNSPITAEEDAIKLVETSATNQPVDINTNSEEASNSLPSDTTNEETVKSEQTNEVNDAVTEITIPSTDNTEQQLNTVVPEEKNENDQTIYNIVESAETNNVEQVMPSITSNTENTPITDGSVNLNETTVIDNSETIPNINNSSDITETNQASPIVENNEQMQETNSEEVIIPNQEVAEKKEEVEPSAGVIPVESSNQNIASNEVNEQVIPTVQEVPSTQPVTTESVPTPQAENNSVEMTTFTRISDVLDKAVRVKATQGKNIRENRNNILTTQTPNVEMQIDEMLKEQKKLYEEGKTQEAENMSEKISVLSKSLAIPNP